MNSSESDSSAQLYAFVRAVSSTNIRTHNRTNVVTDHAPKHCAHGHTNSRSKRGSDNGSI